MPDFLFPGDALSRPEYRLFEDSFRSKGAAPTAPLFVFSLLKLVLAYQAEVTSRPGFLSKQAIGLMSIDLAKSGLSVDDARDSLLAGGVIQPCEDGWMDPLFARQNPALSPKHRRSTIVGAEHSRIKRNRRNIAAEAAKQQMLLPPQTFQDEQGQPIAPDEINRTLTLIKTIDMCIDRPADRRGPEFTAGLVADAVRALRSLPAEWSDAQREQFLYWISDMRTDPRMFTPTESLLAHFETVLEMYRARLTPED
jgi:hypothetical protein